MKRLFWCLVAAGCLVGSSLHAQIPARPVDPDQPRPAQPVTPDNPVPTPQPAKPVGAPSAPTSSAPTPAPAAEVGPDDVSVIADSSLKAVIQELAQAWADTQDTGPQVPITLTNAGTLVSKVEAKPQWDVIISADAADVKEMSDHGLFLVDSQRSLARNTLVVYGRKALVKDDDQDWFDLVGDEWKKVALGNPDLVASGRVARLAMQHHSLSGDSLKNVLVNTPNERSALAAAQSEKADAVFLYKTDLLNVSLPGFAVFPMKPEDAPPVFYTAAISRTTKNEAQAKAFIGFCLSEAARPIWVKYGFEPH